MMLPGPFQFAPRAHKVLLKYNDCCEKLVSCLSLNKFPKTAHNLFFMIVR